MKIAVAQRKGGVGKTATTRELAVALSQIGKSVLVVDVDDQHNITNHFNIVSPQLTLSGLLMTDADPETAVNPSVYGPDVIASDSKLAQVELGMAMQPDNTTIFAEVLEPLLGNYDYVLFDCGPKTGLMTMNAIDVADAILAPVSSDGEDSLGGIVLLLKALTQEQRAAKPVLTIKTRWQDERTLTADIDESLATLGLPCIGTIKERARMRESVSQGPLGYRLPDNELSLEFRRIAETLDTSEVASWLAAA